MVVLPIVREPFVTVKLPFAVQAPMSCLSFQFITLVLSSDQSCPVFQFMVAPLPLGSFAYPTFQFSDTAPVVGLYRTPFFQSTESFPVPG